MIIGILLHEDRVYIVEVSLVLHIVVAGNHNTHGKFIILADFVFIFIVLALFICDWVRLS